MNSAARQNIFLGLFLSAGLLLFLISPCFAADADDKYGFKKAAEKTPLVNLSLSNSTPEALVQKIVQGGLLFVGTVFFLLVLYAGVLWLIARGQSQKVDVAKQILETAIVGLVIVTMSYAISTFVFNKLTTKETVAETPAVEGECKNKAEGSSCGDNMLCYEGECKEECLVDFKTGSCDNPNDCLKRDGYAVVPGKCPDGEDNMCCITIEEWDSIKLP